MAKNNTQANSQPEDAAVAPMAAQETPKSVAPTEYTVEEFAGAARAIFGNRATPDCVTAAFRLAGRKKATKAEAQSIVNNFITKEVK